MGICCSSTKKTKTNTNSIHSSTQDFIIEFIRIENVPKADYTSESDPFIRAQIVEETSKNKYQPISEKIKTPYLFNNKNPVYHSYQNFHCTPKPEHFLQVEIHDFDLELLSNLIGVLYIPINELQDEDIKNFPVNKYSRSSRNDKTASNFVLYLRRVYMNKKPALTKTFFIIRHGESKWNKAQDDRNLIGLINNDHSLTSKGITQADNLNERWKISRDMITGNHIQKENEVQNRRISMALRTNENVDTLQSNSVESINNSDDSSDVDDLDESNDADNQMLQNFRKSRANIPIPVELQQTLEAFSNENKQDHYTKLFLEADQIFVSPLTRAIQTALVALQDHSAMLQKGLTLYSVIREVKGQGGMDSVGTKYGLDNILARVRSELLNVGCPQDLVDELTSVAIDVNDANMPWWTPQLEKDSAASVQGRVKEFLNFVRYYDAKNPIFVGHSLFFKSFYKYRVSEQLEARRPQLAANLQKYKLGNAALLAVTVLFSDEKDIEPIILDAELLFDSTFHTHS